MASIDSRWTYIDPKDHTEVYGLLKRERHGENELLSSHHMLSPVSIRDQGGAERCRQCGVTKSSSRNATCTYHPGKLNYQFRGANNRKTFTCCRSEDPKKRCTTVTGHKFEPTPAMKKRSEAVLTPPRLYVKRAVTLDCEMASIENGHDVISISMVDFLTGQVLIDKLVCPEERITQWSTFIHGIRPQDMRDAVGCGEALMGWQAARQEIWKYIDSDTIIIGHAVRNDLDVLGMLHLNIVDSAIIAKHAVGPLAKQTSLQNLMQECLGHIPFRHNQGGKHDCLEDVMATREIVLFCLLNRPGFEAWAARERQVRELKKASDDLARAKKLEARLKNEANKAKAEVPPPLW